MYVYTYRYLGCSAGVSALAGANLCITVEQILRYGYNLVSSRSTIPTTSIL
jgi:hypothetical protein